MKLRFTSRSIQDLAEISDYIRARNPAASLRVRAAILETLSILLDFPNAGRPQTVEGVRKIMTRRYPYIIYYSVDTDDKAIVVLSLRHAAQRREFSDL
jgi:toxin ParE1/3/4